MPIYAECDICGKKYRFADEQAGRTVPCKECTADFEVSKPPILDRRVLIGVGVTIGAMVGLFLIAVIVIEIVGASSRPTAVAVAPPTPLPTLPRITATPSPPPQGSSEPIVQPVFPSIPNPTPQPVVPRPSAPVIPPVNVPPKSVADIRNAPPVVPAIPRPPAVVVPPREPPMIRAFEPTTVAEGGDLTIQGDQLRFAAVIQFLSIHDPKVRNLGTRRAPGDPVVTFRVPSNLVPSSLESELFVMSIPSAFGHLVTVPKRLVEWKEGQPLPADYEPLVYVPADAHRQVGAGHHVVFVESGATVDLNGTSGSVFLRRGARIGLTKDVPRLDITAENLDSSVNVPGVRQLGQKVEFFVVEDLVRVTKIKR